MSPGQVTGRALVYNARSVNLGGFREVIHPDALRGLSLDDVLLLRDHDSSRVLARTTAGDLKLTNTRNGLDFSAAVVDTTEGHDTYKLLAGGQVRQCSFAFLASLDSWYEDSEGTTIRVVETIRALPEISVVSFPAYPSSYAGTGAMRAQGAVSSEARALLALHRASKPSDEYSPRSLMLKGYTPVPRPSWVPSKFAKRALQVRSASEYGEPPIEVTAALMEPDLAALDLLELYGANAPSHPGRAGWSLAAYRSLAESRGVALDDVLQAAREGRLAEVVRMEPVDPR